jgi:hypothetical protein
MSLGRHLCAILAGVSGVFAADAVGSVTAVQATMTTALASLSPEDVVGGEARAKLLAAIPRQGLEAEAHTLLAVATAESWLEADDIATARLALQGIAVPGPGSLRNRLDLLRIELWLLAHQKGEVEPEPVLVGASAQVRARFLSVRAHIAFLAPGDAIDGTVVLRDLDAALALIEGESLQVRRSFLILRVRAMERLGADSAQVSSWLSSRKEDPKAFGLAPVGGVTPATMAVDAPSISPLIKPEEGKPLRMDDPP